MKQPDAPVAVPSRFRRWAALSLAVPLLASCINPNIVNKQGGNLYPLAPGDRPFVLVTILNDTQADIDLQVTVDTGATTPLIYFFQNLDPGLRTAGVLIPYPFLRVAIGPLDNPLSPSITATFNAGLTVRVPFAQNPLVAGTDFGRGDTILFDVISDARSETAISVSTGIVQASTQAGPFTRADTFATVEGLLLLNGLTGSITTP